MLKLLFGDVLSCGFWILNRWENNKYLKKVILIDEKSEKDIIYFTDEVVGNLSKEDKVTMLLELVDS